MTAQFLQVGPTFFVGQQIYGKDWVASGSARNSHNGGGDLTNAMSQTKVNTSLVN